MNYCWRLYGLIESNTKLICNILYLKIALHILITILCYVPLDICNVWNHVAVEIANHYYYICPYSCSLLKSLHAHLKLAKSDWVIRNNKYHSIG